MTSLFAWITHILDIVFFTAVTGAVLVVVLSWISIFRDGFSPD
ncbi:MAG TPA: hypothetical protein VGR96_12525 [Acidobacteriaceae bacterium]|nr:hypothetical protein [Acidobacteriaceae bacterium]